MTPEEKLRAMFEKMSPEEMMKLFKSIQDMAKLGKEMEEKQKALENKQQPK